MSSMFGQMANTQARGNYVYLGVGDYLVQVLEVKHNTSELKYIVEAEILEARPVPMPGEDAKPTAAHMVGDTVSWLVNYGGTKEQREMSLKDIRGFNDALIASAGGNVATWTAQNWEEFGERAKVAANVAGIKLRVRATQYVKRGTGEIGKIPRAAWSAVKDQPRRPELVDVYGATTTAPKAAPAPRPPTPPKPGATARHAQHAEVVEAARGFLEAGESVSAGTELHKWAVSIGMTDAQYDLAIADAKVPF